ncbi:MAG: CoA transferase [Clostridiales Family XIII bacterium]|nr:CoA transferase [Clostridiales Family XIII bacterium]
MRPLEGLKILDFSTLLPGPYATMTLADLGADVLRVTTNTRVDMLDVTPPLLPGSEFSAAAAQLGRNKRSILLNLRSAAAIDIVKELITEYDIVIEQFRPGVMEKLGLGYEDLSSINPKLIYCSITGYGQNTEWSARAGHDINFLSLGGVPGYSGRIGQAPSLDGVQIGDLVGGTQNAIVSILAAVYSREKTGEGQYLDVAMTDGVLALHAIWGPGTLLTGESPEPEGTLLNGGTLYDYYETSDGKFMSFAGLEPKFWEGFCLLMEKPEWISLTVDAGDAVKNEVREIFKSKTRAEWEATFRSVDVCAEPVLSLTEALNSDYAKKREMVVDVPSENGENLRQIGCPYKFSKTPAAFQFAGRPADIQQTRENLSRFGFSDEQIIQWEAEGVLK